MEGTGAPGRSVCSHLTVTQVLILRAASSPQKYWSLKHDSPLALHCCRHTNCNFSFFIIPWRFIFSFSFFFSSTICQMCQAQDLQDKSSRPRHSICQARAWNMCDRIQKRLPMLRVRPNTTVIDVDFEIISPDCSFYVPKVDVEKRSEKCDCYQNSNCLRLMTNACFLRSHEGFFTVFAEKLLCQDNARASHLQSTEDGFLFRSLRYKPEENTITKRVEISLTVCYCELCFVLKCSSKGIIFLFIFLANSTVSIGSECLHRHSPMINAPPRGGGPRLLVIYFFVSSLIFCSCDSAMKRWILIMTRLCDVIATSHRDPGRHLIAVCQHCVKIEPETFLRGWKQWSWNQRRKSFYLLSSKERKNKKLLKQVNSAFKSEPLLSHDYYHMKRGNKFCTSSAWRAISPFPHQSLHKQRC